MNPTVHVSAGVTLIALAGGLFLLAKTMKDNLGLLYKILAWFIIVACFLNFISMSVFCAARFWSKHYMMNKEMMMHERFMMKDGMERHHGFDGMMMYHHGDGMMEEHDGCCREKSCGADDSHWKKCYEELKDSCARQNTNKTMNK
jgi:hypothetical protein